SLQSAVDLDFAYARAVLDLFFDDLICQFCQFAQWPGADKRNRQRGRLITVEFGNNRRLRIRREQAEGCGHAIPDVLRCRLDVPVQVERRDNDRRTLPRVRPQLRNTFNGVYSFLDHLRYGNFDLFRRGARQVDADRHCRQFDLRMFIDVQLKVARHADDDNGEHDHRSEYRKTYTELSQPLHVMPKISLLHGDVLAVSQVPRILYDLLTSQDALENLDSLIRPPAGLDSPFSRLAAFHR